MKGVPEQAIFRSLTVYNKQLFNQCKLLAQIEQVQDKRFLLMADKGDLYD